MTPVATQDFRSLGGNVTIGNQSPTKFGDKVQLSQEDYEHGGYRAALLTEKQWDKLGILPSELKAYGDNVGFDGPNVPVEYKAFQVKVKAAQAIASINIQQGDDRLEKLRKALQEKNSLQVKEASVEDTAAARLDTLKLVLETFPDHQPSKDEIAAIEAQMSANFREPSTKEDMMATTDALRAPEKKTTKKQEKGGTE